MFAHLASLVGLIIPLGNIVGPLVVWLIKKDEMAFVDDQGKEALNFNITVGLIGLALFLLTIITFGIGAILTAPLGVVLAIAWIAFTIIAAIKANEGQSYRYPFTLRLVK
ncbi:DUF4870 domain-containing protein [Lysobacter sp. SG-8]|uniref:DUF4870 domain-containing protein n=2 Tax=Marilutibacter penaei TaxID=2759900 RepID=A0A7W3YF10_9GAMM|nr:DUF4870 domain-containing protein [Lysobacter penaei]MBB1089399.1 DUF4870 domain-containing protein [Lysobacter penaei]